MEDILIKGANDSHKQLEVGVKKVYKHETDS